MFGDTGSLDSDAELLWIPNSVEAVMQAEPAEPRAEIEEALLDL